MRDDEMMDGMLRAAMSAPPPAVSPAFSQAVLRRTTPRRLTPAGRVAMGVYALVSVALCVWTMRDLPVVITTAAIVAQAIVAVGLRSYVKSLTALPYRS